MTDEQTKHEHSTDPQDRLEAQVMLRDAGRGNAEGTCPTCFAVIWRYTGDATAMCPRCGTDWVLHGLRVIGAA